MTYDDIMKQKAKDTKKALHEQAIKEKDEAMQKEIDAEADNNKKVEEAALENNKSSIEKRDENKVVQETQAVPQKMEEKVVEETPAVEMEVPPVEAEETVPPTIESKLTEVDLPQEVINEIIDSDEGQQVQTAVEDNDPSELENIVTPEGEAVLKGSYDENGNYIPYTYTEADTRLIKDKGWAAVLTVLSGAISAFGVLAGIPIPPINFFKFGASPQEDLERLQSIEDNYAKLRNAGTAEAQSVSKTREAEQKANVSDINAYKNIDQNDVQKAASVNASVGGQNTQLDVNREAQAFEKEMKEMDQDFQKEMNNLNTDSQIAILQQQGINQQTLAQLMNDLEVQKVFKKMEYAKEHGFTNDQIAKFISSENGTTTLARGLGYAKDGAEAVGAIVDTFVPGKSDKNVKVFDGKAANTKMFSKVRPKWR